MANEMYLEFLAFTNKVHNYFQIKNQIVIEPVKMIDGTISNVIRTITQEEFDNQAQWHKISTDALLFLMENQM